MSTFLTLAGLLWLSGCSSLLQKIGLAGPPSAHWPSQDLSSLAPDLLEKANLNKTWTTKLPLPPKTSLKKMFYSDNKLYVLTDRNLLYALDGNSGTLLWSCPLPFPLAA